LQYLGCKYEYAKIQKKGIPYEIKEIRNLMKNQDRWLSELGIRLKTERENQGLTQQALANKANTKQDYIAQIERGSRNPSLRTFMNILTGLDISADYLIYGTSKERTDEMSGLINDFTSFLSRRSMEDATAYYDIVHFMSKYVDSDSK
jgi:transcriptional regulator with XRE-family HTH domain